MELGRAPDFVVRIDTEMGSEIDFNTKIRQLRRRFAEKTMESPSFLTVKKNPPKEIIVADMIYNTDTVGIAIRWCDLYLIAFNNGSGWMELPDPQKPTQHLISNSNLLTNITSSYGTLRDKANYVPFSLIALEESVEYMSKITYAEIIEEENFRVRENTQARVCQCITMLIYLLSESIRFYPIADEIGKHLTGYSGHVTSWMSSLVGNWAKLSKLAVKYYGKPAYFKIPDLKDLNIEFEETLYRRGEEFTVMRKVKKMRDLSKVLAVLAREKEDP